MSAFDYPTSNYTRDREELESRKCESCGGLGIEDDAHESDIGFNTWTCNSCNGTGYKS